VSVRLSVCPVFNVNAIRGQCSFRLSYPIADTLVMVMHDVITGDKFAVGDCVSVCLSVSLSTSKSPEIHAQFLMS